MGLKEIHYVDDFGRAFELSQNRPVTAVFSVNNNEYRICGRLRKPDIRCPGARYFIQETGMDGLGVDGWWPIDENAEIYIGWSPKPENLIGVVVVS